jgi:hypothetical protein
LPVVAAPIAGQFGFGFFSVVSLESEPENITLQLSSILTNRKGEKVKITGSYGRNMRIHHIGKYASADMVSYEVLIENLYRIYLLRPLAALSDFRNINSKFVLFLQRNFFVAFDIFVPTLS